MNHQLAINLESHRSLESFEKSIELLVQRGSHVENHVFYEALKRCIAQRNLVVGRRIHALAVQSGYESSPFVANHVLRMYASNGRLKEAMEVFNKVPGPSRHMWASIILAHARHGHPWRAIELYHRFRKSGVQPDNHIFVAALTACAIKGDLSSGKEVHIDALGSPHRHNVFVGNALVDMYSKCGSLLDARKVFDNMPTKDVVTWNAMIAGYAHDGLGHEALDLYETMQCQRGIAPDVVTFASLLQACTSIRDIYQGKLLHAQIRKRGLETNVVVGTCLVDMHAKCGCLEDARRLFNNLPNKNVVTWNAMIAGYAQQGLGNEALEVYGTMQLETSAPADAVTFVSVLQGCTAIKALQEGKQIHAQIRQRGLHVDVVIGTSLLQMYSRCGSLEDAQEVFNTLPRKNLVTWTAMIAAYALHGLGQQALTIYECMQQVGLVPDNAATFLCLLQACSSVSGLEKGKEIHHHIAKGGLEANYDAALANALIDMYGKCGSMADAQQVFDALTNPDVVAWSSLIAGYARQGESKLVFDLFQRMRGEDMLPNGITFLAILKVCSHVGLVEKGQKYFEMMTAEYGISPTLEHFTCLIDLLGRVGQLDNAMAVVNVMPAQPDFVVWMSILGACQQWRSVELGRHAFDCAVKLDASDPAPYVLMSNIYTVAQMEEKAKEILGMGASNQACQNPGRSWWTDVAGVMHAFTVADTGHSEWHHLDSGLKDIFLKINHDGNLAQARSVLCEMDSHYESRMTLGGGSDEVQISGSQAVVVPHVHDVALGRVTDLRRPQPPGITRGAFRASIFTFCASNKSSRTAENNEEQIRNWRKVCDKGSPAEAVEALELLVQRLPYVDNSVYYNVLKRCNSQKNLVLGCRIHDIAIKRGFDCDTFLANHFICMYASHGRLENAVQVFEKVAIPSRHMWSSIILAHTRNGQAATAVELYGQMRRSTAKPDKYIFVAVLAACGTAKDLDSGREIHADIQNCAEKMDIFVSNALVDMYSKCGSLEDARRVFNSLRAKDVVTWTAMIAGYAQNGLGEKAIALYVEMQEEGVAPADIITFVCLLQACGSVGALHVGRQLHEQIQKRGLEASVVVATALVDMYVKCRSLEDARVVFDSTPSRNVVTWTAIISGYAQQGLGLEALHLYDCMRLEGKAPANSVTFVCLLQACASIGALRQGTQLHAEIQECGLECDLSVGNGLVSMYAKCGSLEVARSLFDILPTKDVVTWNAMIAGYSHHGLSEQALAVYRSMQREGIAPADAVTYVYLLQACGGVAALEKGKEIHAETSKIGPSATDLYVSSALIDMYGKCGSMVNAQEVFDALPERDTVTWTALLAGYARQGESALVLVLFPKMRHEGIPPNSVTFLTLLTVCNHAGLLEEGQTYFEAMSRDYGIAPNAAHYSCIIDLLGRAGQVDKAIEMVKAMPFPPDTIIWTSVLGACQKWTNVTLGKEAFDCAARLDVRDPRPYVLMSNIYAAAQMWEHANEIRAMRLQAKAWKEPGQSQWTDNTGTVHIFVIGESDHPEWHHIDGTLRELLTQLKEQGGYVHTAQYG